mgnify:FL=1
MDIKEQLKDIKTQLRLSMNGAVSQSCLLYTSDAADE